MNKLIDLVKKLLQNEGIRYLVVGGSNTAITWLLALLLTLLFTSLGWAETTVYWSVSVIQFVVGIIYSFILNRKYTFKADDIPLSRTLPRFLLNVIVCYLIANVAMKTWLDYMFGSVWQVSWPAQYITLIKLLAANVLYIVLNYIGQKFFAFKKPTEAAAEPKQPADEK